MFGTNNISLGVNPTLSTLAAQVSATSLAGLALRSCREKYSDPSLPTGLAADLGWEKYPLAALEAIVCPAMDACCAVANAVAVRYAAPAQLRSADPQRSYAAIANIASLRTKQAALWLAPLASDNTLEPSVQAFARDRLLFVLEYQLKKNGLADRELRELYDGLTAND